MADSNDRRPATLQQFRQLIITPDDRIAQNLLTNEFLQIHDANNLIFALLLDDINDTAAMPASSHKDDAFAGLAHDQSLSSAELGRLTRWASACSAWLRSPFRQCWYIGNRCMSCHTGRVMTPWALVFSNNSFRAWALGQ